MTAATQLPIVNLSDLPALDNRYPDEPEGRRGLFRSPDTLLGLQGFGISFDVLQPGQENCRYHAERDEEEFFYVHAGSCTARLDGRLYRLEAGDVLHTPVGVAHSFIGAGDGPCEIWMIGQTIKPTAADYLPPPTGAIEAGRPPRSINLAELAPVPVQYAGEPEGCRGQSLEVGEAIGLQALYCNIHLLAPGQQDSKFHYHRREEEFFYVMAGTPTLRLGEQTVQTKSGDCIYIPTGLAHCFYNESDQPARIFMLNTVCGQPDSTYPEG